MPLRSITMGELCAEWIVGRKLAAEIRRDIPAVAEDEGGIWTQVAQTLAAPPPRSWADRYAAEYACLTFAMRVLRLVAGSTCDVQLQLLLPGYCYPNEYRGAIREILFPEGDPRARMSAAGLVIAPLSLDGAEYLIGNPELLEYLGDVTIALRGGQYAGVLFTDAESTQFYIADTTGLIRQHVVQAAFDLGYLFVDGPVAHTFARGTDRRTATLRGWLTGGARGDIPA